MTKGELLGDLQDEPNGPRDVLHLQCNGCRGNLQVILPILLINAVDQPELFEKYGTFRKSQFSDSVANLQKENVRDSFEAPQELPEGWASSSFSSCFQQI